MSWTVTQNPHQLCQMASFLDDLESNLKRDSPETAELVSAWLDENMITFQHMATSLAQHIPYIITIPAAFSPSASENIIAGSLQDIATRLHSARLTTPSTAQAMADASGTMTPARRRLGSLGSSVVQAIKLYHSHFDSCEAPGARLHGQRPAQQMHVVILAATCIQAVWHGVVARKRANELRTRRDATLLVSLHFARSRTARRLRRESMQMETDRRASAGQAERQLAETMERQLAMARLREARRRAQRIEALKELQRNEGNKELKELNAMANLVISVHALRWLSRSRAAQAKELRKRVLEAASSPELGRAKLLLQRRIVRRHMSAPTLQRRLTLLDVSVVAKGTGENQ